MRKRSRGSGCAFYFGHAPRVLVHKTQMSMYEVYVQQTLNISQNRQKKSTWVTRALSRLVTGTRLELVRPLQPPASETGVSTNSTTRPRLAAQR